MGPIIYTRPDITYEIKILIWYYNHPRSMHCSLVVQIFRYFSNFLDLKITFKANSSDKLIGYSNFDYIGLINSQKSNDRYIFMLSGRALSHQSKI